MNYQSLKTVAKGGTKIEGNLNRPGCSMTSVPDKLDINITLIV